MNMSLTHRALHALKWRSVGTAIQIVLQFLVGIALARLLSPEAFGTVGLALIVIGFGRLLVSSGFGVALIQYPHITQRHVQAAFTGSVTISLLLFSIVWLLAPAISDIFMQDGLTPIIRVTGISFVFSGMSAAPFSMLRRELRFRTLAGVETASYMIGYGLVGLSLAMLDYGVWSLVAASIVQPLCLATLALFSAKQPVRLYFGFREYRDLFRVASAELLNNLTNYTAQNLSAFMIGRYLGTSALGLYRRSADLIRLPLSHSSAVLLGVMFPLYSTIQGDIPRLRRAHLHAISLTAMVTMVVLFPMATVPDIVIGGLFGEQWKAASGVLQIMCLSGPFMGIIQVLGALSHARGYVFSEWVRQIIYLVILSITLFLLLPFGLEGAALAGALAMFLRYLILAQLSVKLVAANWQDFILAHIPGLLLATTVSVSVYLTSTLMRILEVSDTLQLFLLIVIAILSLVFSLLLFPASWLRDLYPWILDHFGAKLPSWVYKLMVERLSAMKSDSLK